MTFCNTKKRKNKHSYGAQADGTEEIIQQYQKEAKNRQIQERTKFIVQIMKKTQSMATL